MGVRTLLSSVRRDVTAKAMELWEEATGDLTMTLNGSTVVTSQTNPLTERVELTAGGVVIPSVPIVVYSNFVPFALTGTTSETLMGQALIPENLIGPNSVIKVEAAWQWTNNANNKSFNVKVGNAGAGSASSIYARTRTTNQSESIVYSLANRGSKASQVHQLASDYAVNNSNPLYTSAFDFSQSGWAIYFTGTLANSADTLTFAGCTVTIINPAA